MPSDRVTRVLQEKTALIFSEGCVESRVVARSYQSLTRRFGSRSVYAFCAIAFLVVTAGAHGAAPAKRVLLISTGSRFSPGFTIVDQAVLQALRKMESGTVEVYTENLDVVRFSNERFGKIFSDYLIEKYSEKPPDLIIFVYVGNLGTES